MMDEEKITPSDVKIIKKESRLYRFFDNFWYHYKWQTLILLVLTVFLSVCIVQCAQKKSYDLYVLYAGGYEFSASSDSTAAKKRDEVVGALAAYSPDRNGDGDISVAFESLYVLTMDEAKVTEDVNTNRLSTDKTTLSSELIYSDYYICFLSENVYKSYQNSGYFVKLPRNESLEYVDDYAVKLSSLKIASAPGFSSLPKDTVMVFRGYSQVSENTKRKQGASVYAAAEEALSALLQ